MDYGLQYLQYGLHEIPELITEQDVKEKTPALEQFLLDIARLSGAEEAVMFDGSVINLVNSGDKDG